MTKSQEETQKSRGVNAALFSAFFLGLAPIFGKQAINMGMDAMAVVAFRTFFATLLLFLVLLVFDRKYLFIYPAGLLGCIVAGFINGLGSLFYYKSLEYLGAGVGQMLYSLYPFFVAFWMYLDSHPPTRLTLVRLLIAIPAVFLLVQAGEGEGSWVGALMMLIASALYALHLPINQRVLYDLPAPTVTLYTLAAMTAIVGPTYLFSGSLEHLSSGGFVLGPIIGLTLVTFLSRVTLFTGVKNLGGMQTSLLGLSELLITVALAHLWLGEALTWQQWIGAALLTISIFLVGKEPPAPPRNRKGGWFSWFSAPPIPMPSSLTPPNEFTQETGD